MHHVHEWVGLVRIVGRRINEPAVDLVAAGAVEPEFLDLAQIELGEQFLVEARELSRRACGRIECKELVGTAGDGIQEDDCSSRRFEEPWTNLLCRRP